MKCKSTTGAVILAACVTLGLPRLAHACATCFGDPESNIAKGAVSGVMVLGLVLYGLMMCMAGTTFLWWRRGRRIALGQADVSQEGPKRDEGHA